MYRCILAVAVGGGIVLVGESWLARVGVQRAWLGIRVVDGLAFVDRPPPHRQQHEPPRHHPTTRSIEPTARTAGRSSASDA